MPSIAAVKNYENEEKGVDDDKDGGYFDWEYQKGGMSKNLDTEPDIKMSTSPSFSIL